MAGLLCAGVIIYLFKTRKTIQQIVKNEIVEKVIKNEIVQKVEIVRSPAHDLVPDMLVIDGLNVIYGAPAYPNPSLANLLGLLLELQKRNCGFKCFFDANTYFAFKDARKLNEADIFDDLCRAFPDRFVLVPGRTKADDFILDYAHNHGTPIISNDQFRDYEEKYDWLKSDRNRRVSFVVHSGMLQIVPLGMQASVPTDLKSAVSTLKMGFRKPVPTKNEIETIHATNRAHPVALAAFLHGGILLDALREHVDCILERNFWFFSLRARGMLVLQKIHQLQLCGGPDRCFQAFTNELALDF